VTFLILCVLLYFVPAIIGYNKRGFAGIFLFNLFLGWTFIGWFIALIWAVTAERNVPVVVVPTSVHYCSHCGKAQFAGVQYCTGCGKPI